MNSKTKKVLIAAVIAVFVGSKIFSSNPKPEKPSQFRSDFGDYLGNLRKNGY